MSEFIPERRSRSRRKVGVDFETVVLTDSEERNEGVSVHTESRRHNQKDGSDNTCRNKAEIARRFSEED
ncbi:MAG: hypothetical protein Q8P30_03095 [Candidatus Uhrbacteria bacterium]|nr:hypothetical protein [Candidatus Uhrbacteria bacterium]